MTDLWECVICGKSGTTINPESVCLWCRRYVEKDETDHD